jgi:hypothetical protein
MPHLRRSCSLLVVVLLSAAVWPTASWAAGSLTLTWDPPAQTGTAPVGYRLRYGLHPGPMTHERDVGPPTVVTVSGLEAGRTHQFQVFAYDAAGRESPPSNLLLVPIPAGPPGGEGPESPPASASKDPAGLWESLPALPPPRSRMAAAPVPAHITGHADLARVPPATHWYFAEGSTRAPFRLYYRLHNPGDVPAHVDMTYLRPDAAPIVRTSVVPPRGSVDVQVDQEDEALAATDVAAVAASRDGVPIVAERAMYLLADGVVSGGHATLGASEPSADWAMAEGATGSLFALQIVVANPSARAADVRLRFHRPDGVSVTHDMVVPALGRRSVDVAAIDPLLRDTTVWTEVTSINRVPVVAERVMWWPGASWSDGHAARGTAVPAREWRTTGGRTGGPQRHATFVLIANTHTTPQQVAVTVVGADAGSPPARTHIDVPPAGRVTVDVGALFPHVSGSYQVEVAAIGGAGALVVDQTMYWERPDGQGMAGVSAPARAVE